MTATKRPWLVSIRPEILGGPLVIYTDTALMDAGEVLRATVERALVLKAPHEHVYIGIRALDTDPIL
jgi:hypothetical protein